MSDRQEWEKYFKKAQQERAHSKQMKELVSWANNTSSKIRVAELKEHKNGLSPLRLHNTEELPRF